MSNVKQKLKSAYTRLLCSGASIGAGLKVKLGRPVVSHVLRMCVLLGQRVNLSVVKVVISTLATFHRLQKKSGMTFLVIYLKACSTILQQVIGKQHLRDLSPFGARVARTHSGLPSIIPALHRARIRRGDRWAIRFWATLFGLYRVLEVPGRIRLSTITDGSTMEPSLVSEFSQFVLTSFIPVLKKQFPVEGSVTDALWVEDGEGPLQFMKGLRAKPFLITKSGPSVRPYESDSSAQSTSPASILASAYCWRHSSLYPTLESWCKMTGNQWVLNRIGDWAKKLWVWEDSLPLSSRGPKCPFEATNSLGKLGFKPEPAGKVRVFAMVDPWTQWLMKPLHTAIFNLLQAFPQDGTFDQLKPIETLGVWCMTQEGKTSRRPPLFSFDLSAATDRVPICLQKVLLSPFLTSWGAELWGILMVGRSYSCPRVLKLGKTKLRLIPEKEPASVYYGTGQPMGALSSWANLALIHHAFVQWAAVKAGAVEPGKGWYAGYAILGDDVVIAGNSVAKEYRSLIKRAGVAISEHKTLESRSGRALEFAKRTFLDWKDVSMIPTAEVLAATRNLSGMLELIRGYSLTLGQSLTVLGYGYRAKANASGRLINLPRRLRNYLVAFHSPGGPFYAGMKDWLAMRSLTSIYSTAMERVSGLVEQFYKDEIRLILEILDSWQPLIEAARRLGTVYRDREHYGTVPRSAEGSRQTALHPGIERSTPQSIVDSLNETVYRTAFLGSVIAVRDLRTTLEELPPTSLDWEGLAVLWDTVRDIERQLGSLPFPRNITERVIGEKPESQSKTLRRWYRYSRTFRATVTRSGQ